MYSCAFKENAAVSLAFATSLIVAEWTFCSLGLPTAYLVPAPLVFCSFIYFISLSWFLIYCDLKFLLKDKLTTFWRSTMVIIAFAHCVLISLANGNINHFFVKRKLKKNLLQLSWTLWYKTADCNHFLWYRTLLDCDLAPVATSPTLSLALGDYSSICYCFACTGPYSI